MPEEKTQKKQRPFVRCWMFHPKHGSRLFEEETELKEALKDKGWVDTPAKL